jgi:hypothetical protein
MANDAKRSGKRFIVLLAVALSLTVLSCVVGYLSLPYPIVLVADTQSEMRQLDAAMQAFKAMYGVYPPSKIKLCSNCKDYGAEPLDQASIMALSRLWPNIGMFQDIAWAGDGPPVQGEILEGDQCLVFFLGGIPDSAAKEPACLGFARNGKNPAQLGDARVGPFFGFDSDRLVKLRGSRFWSYLDRYSTSQPYAYFSAGNKKNGYNRFCTSDCSALGVWPYAKSLDPQPDYFNPNTFQLISAGPDGKFGPGTALPDGKTWTPQTADQIDPAGRDDLSNFYPMPMGKRTAE